VRKRLTLLNLCVWLSVVHGTGWAVQDFSDLFEQVKSSVVVVKTQGMAAVAGLTGPPVAVKGAGSGVLIAGNCVLTAAHLVQAEDFVVVQFIHGQEIEATVLSSSTLADVALLGLKEIPEQGKPATIGNSNEMKVGEPICIVGAPFEISYTLTTGHISNRVTGNTIGRGLTEIEYFQTDAAINKGNSGGPMFNMKGEVIGLVSGFLTQSGGFEGLGYAVTSRVTKEVLLKAGHVWTGVEAQLIGEPITAILNVPQANAILTQRVAMDSLGSKLRLRPGIHPVTIRGENLKLGGDIILEVQGHIADGHESLARIRKELADVKKGALIQFVVWRHGRRVVLSCKR
jgi:serine protease Do